MEQASGFLWLISLSVHEPYDLLWPLLGDLHDGASERGVRSPELTPHRVELLTCPVPLPVLPSVPLNQPRRGHPAMLKVLSSDSAMHGGNGKGLGSPGVPSLTPEVPVLPPQGFLEPEKSDIRPFALQRSLRRAMLNL